MGWALGVLAVAQARLNRYQYAKIVSAFFESLATVPRRMAVKRTGRPAYPRQMRYNSSAVLENNAACSSRLKPEMISL